jgi:ABC-type Fe3+/spermidine/putrescine transport system ATPase subunit
MENHFLVVKNIFKTYNNAPLLRGVSFEVNRGEITCLLGPSGSGKTTLLRIIAGLENAEGGGVHLDEVDITRTPVHLRGIVLMFQDYALFPHRTVKENVAFGLRMQKELSPTEATTRVMEILHLVGLDYFAERNVIELSGGERQRVALARSLAPNPKLLLLDEPLGALDRNLRERLLRELPDILRTVGVTTITVTHDQEEAFALADRVVILHDGKVAQQGAPEQVYRKPVNTWVADFLGLDNQVPAVVTGENTVKTDFGQVFLTSPLPEPGSKGQLLVYPAAVQFTEPGVRTRNSYKCQIQRTSFHGHTHSILLAIGSIELQTLLVGGCNCSAGDSTHVWLDPANLGWLTNT